MSASKPLIIPAPLKPGDRIAIPAPAGIPRPQYVYKAMQILRDMGWEPYVTGHALGRCGTYSGTDQERYEDLEAAILDTSTKAILCARGGYGAVHLLERLDRLPLRDNAKWLIGFSDISALHGLMHRHGIASVHGPMAKHVAAYDGKDDNTRALFDVLQGYPLKYDVPAHKFNRIGEASGVLVGGNMAVLSGLVNTPYDMFLPDTVLFIEDVAEPVYKIERMLYQLKLSGVLAGLKGLLVGSFTDYSPDVDNASMESMIHEMTAEYDYPVAFNVPIGHDTHNLPLVESSEIVVEVGGLGVRISQPLD